MDMPTVQRVLNDSRKGVRYEVYACHHSFAIRRRPTSRTR